MADCGLRIAKRLRRNPKSAMVNVAQKKIIVEFQSNNEYFYGFKSF